MAFWQTLLVHALVTAVVVISIITVFYSFILKPFLAQKMAELRETAEQIEPRVTAGVKRGMADSLKGIPETAVKDSTRQFLKFGSDLFENGLSSFLGTADDLARRSSQRYGNQAQDKD